MIRATNRVNWNVQNPTRIPALGTERALFRLTKQLPDLVWNAAALEGNTFTLPEVRTLLDGVTVGGKALPEQQQILDLSEAFGELHTLVSTGEFSVTPDVSHRIHTAVARNEALDAGMFRGDGAVAGDGGGVRLMNGGFVDFDPAEGLHEAFSDLVESLNLLDDPVERALAYFCSATRTQFYFDGNKRTARLIASGMLMTAGYSALNIPNARRLEFNLALDQLFSTDDATELMEFLYDCLAESSR
ncbi:hypothetical protein F7230_00155 [Corynebacterium sp. 320]|uniref:Fic family protein n=1 Tax=Corynebacterium TaxID=1716 RepID=UPI00125CAA19|nr:MULTISPECIES: Fic family protein [Corynebacterium]KAB1503592.1 hypothetical protein F7230_00155 [Corynebacterium sp. 320]KAB1553307.1 hypothetical protein F7233_06435 [Corynebacterium sp. 321]KAB3527728.1 hypothetical protein F8354_00155 [Corynebacterium sp. 250]QNP92950.1 Fic family protein [Corynebacterium zhongnanshanii]